MTNINLSNVQKQEEISLELSWQHYLKPSSGVYKAIALSRKLFSKKFTIDFPRFLCEINNYVSYAIDYIHDDCWTYNEVRDFVIWKTWRFKIFDYSHETNKLGKTVKKERAKQYPLVLSDDPLILSKVSDIVNNSSGFRSSSKFVEHGKAFYELFEADFQSRLLKTGLQPTAINQLMTDIKDSFFSFLTEFKDNILPHSYNETFQKSLSSQKQLKELSATINKED